MANKPNLNKRGNDELLKKVLLQLSSGIDNGTVTIVKQDSIVIQINTSEKIKLTV